ncbi:uncharacterized protein [Dendropsophus ebraccatus]|uniref:uncharacterized protein n=1 Tax=Dendropsophus ebraccatus TaxID=150705 RepID=UPI0038320EC3
MENLLAELLRKAEGAGGEAWLRRCLQEPVPTVAEARPEEEEAGPSRRVICRILPPRDPAEQEADAPAERHHRSRNRHGERPEKRRRSSSKRTGSAPVPPPPPEESRARGDRRHGSSSSRRRHRSPAHRDESSQQPSSDSHTPQHGGAAESAAVVHRFQASGAGGRSGGHSVSKSSVVPDLGVTAQLIRSAVAPRTWAAYSAAWSQWKVFCLSLQEHYLQHDVWLTLAFVNMLISKHLSHSAIVKMLAGVSFFLKLFGFSSVSGFFIVKQVLKGYKKGRVSPDARRPITVDLLLKLHGSLVSVCSSDFEVVLFQALFSLAFFGAFRLGELVSFSKISPSGLLLSDVSISSGILSVLIRFSKTDQLGRGSVLRINAFSGSEVCPIKCLSSYLAIRPAIDGVLFIHEDLSFVTRYQFNRVLRLCLVNLGLGNLRFTSHSFRIGAATEAASAGLDEQLIRRLGRWDSNRFKLYIRPALVL